MDIDYKIWIPAIGVYIAARDYTPVTTLWIHYQIATISSIILVAL